MTPDIHDDSGQAIQVLYLIDQFYAGYGGTEQHLLFLLRTLSSRSIVPHFAVLSGIRRYDPKEFPVLPVILSDGCPRGPIGFFHRINRLARLISDKRIDVVHAFCPMSEIAALIAARLARRGKVLGVRRNLGYWHTWRSRLLARLFARFGAQYVANCEAARQYASRTEWISPKRITVIRNPVSSRRLQEGLASVPTRESLGIANGDRIVGMVATVRPIKDYATFLRSARLVLDKFPKTVFLVIGYPVPEYLAKLQALATELRIESRILWLGAVDNPFSLLPHFDVGVMSSLSEGFSNSLLEYAAAGIATVATNVGGTPEIVVEGQTGFLVLPQNAQALADRICTLLDNRALREQFGQRACDRIHSLFSQEVCLDAYRDLYQSLSTPSLLTFSPAFAKGCTK